MQRRRVAPALLLILALLPLTGGGSTAFAQSVEEADQARKDAYRLVDQAATDREAIETRLFDALNAFQAAAEDLAVANGRLTRVERKLAVAEATAATLQTTMHTTVTNAYIEGLGGTGLSVFAHDDVDALLLAEEILRGLFGDTQQEIDQIVAIQAELTGLRTEMETERQAVEQLVGELDAKADGLEILFAQADAELATAYALARQAEVDYRQAVSAAEAARAAREAEARRKESGSLSGGSGGGPTITIKPSTEAWRPVVEAHFPARLVADALKIMQCESGGDPNAVNPYSGAAGLYQFLPTTWAVASVKAGVGGRSVFDGEANIIAAAWLAGYYESRGYSPWQPWTCRFYL